jgi:CRP-like cAMP-binding protein
MDRRREILRNSHLFSVLTEPELIYATEQTIVRHVGRGQAIVRRNDLSCGLHTLLEGFAKLTSESEEGTEVIYELLRAGAWFGETALIDGGPESVSAIATHASTVMSLNKNAVLELMERNRRLGVAFAKVIATRVRTQDRRIADMQLYDLSTRLARTLLELLREHGAEPESAVVKMTFPLTQTELAAMLGATRVRVNMVLGVYRDAGIIHTDRTGISILSPERLSERARMSDA